MKSTLMSLGVVAALVVSAPIGWAGADSAGKEPIYVSADKASFKEVVPGVSKSLVWGKAEDGPYGSFTKFTPGLEPGMHTHTNDVWLVVLKGAYLYKDAAGEKRVGAGDFLRIPGGHKHWSGGDKKEGALFYEESTDSFDLVPVK